MVTDQTAETHSQRRDIGALWERVESHGNMIRQLTVEVSDQFRDMRAETSQQLTQLAANLGEQVRGSNATIDKIATKLDSNAAAMAERSRPQYLALMTAMVAALGLSVTITQVLTGLHDKPVDDKLTALTTAIGDLTHNTAASFGEAARNTVSRDTYNLTLDYQKQLAEARIAGRDTVRAQMQKDIERVDAGLQREAAQVVPRTELEFHWNAEGQTDARLQAEVDALSHRLDSIVPTGDAISRLISRQHDLEVRVYGEDKR